MSRARIHGWIPVALLAAFAAGVLSDEWFRRHGPPKPVSAGPEVAVFAAPAPVPAPAASDLNLRKPAASEAPAPPHLEDRDLPPGRLRLPIDGVDVESLQNGFAERRTGDRPHEAVDMLAPRNTPVHAVDSGTIAKLFTSKAGGLTIYQFDSDGRLCYYYAHLERYADGLTDGQAVSRGDVIGYVGTTGNAPPDAPHLHFAVFELKADRHWWQGTALDPYQVFTDRR